MKVSFSIGVVVVAVLFFEIAKVSLAYHRARPLAEEASVFAHHTKSSTTSVLVIGDSTGYGTGASKPEDSVAGRLSKDFPHASIENRSINGLKISGAISILERVHEEDRYHVVLLQIGGNDVLYFSSQEEVRREMRELFALAKKHSDNVVMMSTGDIGTAPAFGPLLSFFYHRRTLSFREMFMEEAKKAGVQYVDLYVEKKDDPFALDPWKYHSSDGLHPTSAGYALWYEKLKPVISGILKL